MEQGPHDTRGQDHRLADRYQASIPCVLVFPGKRRLLGRAPEVSVDAEIVTVSINGADVVLAAPDRAPSVAVGDALSFRCDDMDGLGVVRHMERTDGGLDLGIQFTQLSDELRTVLYEAMETCRPDGASLRDQWEQAR